MNNRNHLRNLKVVVLLLVSFVFTTVAYEVHAKWWTTSRDSAGLAPDPAVTPEAIIQVYGARAYGWRGYFGIHTWFAVKPSDADTYTIYEVIGWRQRRRLSVLAVYDNVPDRRWYGSMPVVLAEKKGAGVDELIQRIDQVAYEYPYARRYTVWPGPNSNTFTAWVSRAVPELALDLPPTAIGKDYLGYRFISLPPSGTGLQFSVFGLFGVLVSSVEGLELNLLGLTFGVTRDPWGVKLPLVGHVDMSLYNFK